MTGVVPGAGGCEYSMRRGAGRAAGVELVRGQTHSTSLRSAQGDKVGAEGFGATQGLGMFVQQISRLRFVTEGELRSTDGAVSSEFLAPGLPSVLFVGC